MYRVNVFKGPTINLSNSNKELSNNKATKAAYFKYIDFKDPILNIKTKIVTENTTVIGIETLLNIKFIALGKLCSVVELAEQLDSKSMEMKWYIYIK